MDLPLFLLIAFICFAVGFPLLHKKEWMRRSLRWLWSARTEWLAVPISVALFMLSSIMLRKVDPTAGVFDVGVLQVLFVSATQLFVAMTTAQVAVAISYRRLWRPLKEQPVCRERYVALYALYFLGAVVLMAAL